MVLDQLMDMANEIVKADRMNLHCSLLQDKGERIPYQPSLAKKYSAGQSLRVARMARALHKSKWSKWSKWNFTGIRAYPAFAYPGIGLYLRGGQCGA